MSIQYFEFQQEKCTILGLISAKHCMQVPLVKLTLMACLSRYASKNLIANWYVSSENVFAGVRLWFPWVRGETPWSTMCLRTDLIWWRVVFSRYRKALTQTSRPWNINVYMQQHRQFVFVKLWPRYEKISFHWNLVWRLLQFTTFSFQSLFL